MSTDLTDDDRVAFEAWAKSPPFEWDTARYPDDPDNYAWPGSYRSHVTLCGWEAWQAGLAAGRARERKATIEEAATVVDQWRRTETRDLCCDQAQHDALNDCAAAIRALNAPAAP